MYIFWEEAENLPKSLNKRVFCGILETRNGRALCPFCGRPTSQRVNPDTVLRNAPLWCKYCRTESIVNTEEPEPESQSQHAKA